MANKLLKYTDEVIFEFIHKNGRRPGQKTQEEMGMYQRMNLRIRQDPEFKKKIESMVGKPSKGRPHTDDFKKWVDVLSRPDFTGTV